MTGHAVGSPPTSKVQDVVPFEGRFPSWEAFDVARKAHCEKTHTMYVCRNTVKVEVANKRRKLQVPASWVYDRKVRPFVRLSVCASTSRVGLLGRRGRGPLAQPPRGRRAPQR
jgi:hypothetical protein